MAALSALLPGCGGGGGQPGGGVLVAAGLLRAADGKNGRLLTLNAATTLVVQLTDRGGAPLAGQSVLFVGPRSGPGGTFAGSASEGRHVLRAQTDGNGTVTAGFTANAQAGVYLVSALVEGTNTALSFAITNVTAPAATALSPEQAHAGIAARFFGGRPEDETLRLHGPALLLPGTAVAPEIPNARGATAPIAVGRPSWFFWLDEAPAFAFSHPTRFILVDAGDARPDLAPRAHVVAFEWWPRVTLPGGQVLRFYPAIQAADALPATPLIAGAPESRAEPDPHRCAILVQGPDGSGAFASDIERYREFLIRKKRVPPANIQPPAGSGPQSLDDVRRMIQDAKRKGCKKVFLIIVAHGNPLGCALRDPGGADLTRQLTSYETIAREIATIGADEVCAVVSACKSGVAVGAFQNLGIDGQIATSCDPFRDGQMYWDGQGRGFCSFNPAFIDCWDNLLADTNFDGDVDLREAMACFLQAQPEGAESRKGNPQVDFIGERAPESYGGLPNVELVTRGARTTIVVRYPPGVPSDTPFRYVLTIANPNIATFNGPSSRTVTLQNGESDTVPILAGADGQTTYRLTGRAGTGQFFESPARTIRVGSALRGQPDPATLEVGQTFPVNIQREGVLARLPDPVTVGVTSADAQVASVSPATLTFPAGVLTLPVAVRAGYQVGETTLRLNSTTHGVTGTVAVKVEQVVTLMRDLLVGGQILYRKGERIRTDRITGEHVAPPDQGCDFWHLHTEGGAITVDGRHTFDDPDPGGCGFGHVIQPQ